MNPTILYEDPSLLVCIKPAGVPTQSSQIQVPDMVSLLKNHLVLSGCAAPGKEPYLATIHRLDQPVEGILVFGKTPAAAKELSRQLQAGQFQKYYYALLSAAPSHHSGSLEDFLIKEPRGNISKICSANTPGAKKALLDYKIIDTKKDIPLPVLVEIHLHTGRHHQIRVQMAHAGCPLVGDTKYVTAGATVSSQPLSLCARRLCFLHPKTKKEMDFSFVPAFAKPFL